MIAEEQIKLLQAELKNVKELYQQRFDNIEEIYNKRLDDIEEKLDKATSDRKEDFYQRHLEKLLNGRHKKSNHGFSDVENEESIHEIKSWKDYKNVVGQLKAYSFKQAKRKRLVAAFYGDASERHKEKAVEFLNSEQIDVIELVDLPDGGIIIKKLGVVDSNSENSETSLTELEQDDKNISDFVQHLIRDSKRILKRHEVKDVYKKLYAEICTKEINGKIDAEILKQFKIEFKKSQHFGEFYRGWLGLRFKTKEELETS